MITLKELYEMHKMSEDYLSNYLKNIMNTPSTINKIVTYYHIEPSLFVNIPRAYIHTHKHMMGIPIGYTIYFNDIPVKNINIGSFYKNDHLSKIIEDKKNEQL